MSAIRWRWGEGVVFMENVKLDDIPYLIASKKMSVPDARVHIYTALYLNPARFNLQELDEDTRSDFLLDFFQNKTEKLIQNFNPELSLFGAYVYYMVQVQKLTYINTVARKNSFNRTVMHNAISDYHEKMEQIMDSVTEIAETVPPYTPESDEDEIPHLVYRRLLKKEPHRLSAADSYRRKLKIGILLLALKSAWYISDEQINKVSKICRISSGVLTDSICTLKSKLINKALNRERIEQARNRAYCFIHDYKTKLEKDGEPENGIVFTRHQKRLAYHTDSWQTKTRTLQTGGRKIAPTNSEIAGILGLTDKWVSQYLTKIKKLDFSKADFIGSAG